MKRLFLISLTFSLAIFSCSNKDSYQKETIRFCNYLKVNFNHTISTSQEVYFIIPTYYCTGCKQYLVYFLQHNNNKSTLITVDNTLNGISENTQILYDSNKMIDRLNIGTSNVMSIVVKDSKITQIKEIKPGDNLDELYIDSEVLSIKTKK